MEGPGGSLGSPWPPLVIRHASEREAWQGVVSGEGGGGGQR
jgi:hypothetical protein